LHLPVDFAVGVLASERQRGEDVVVNVDLVGGPFATFSFLVALLDEGLRVLALFVRGPNFDGYAGTCVERCGRVDAISVGLIAGNGNS
jgi:hypothetical protein